MLRGVAVHLEVTTLLPDTVLDPNGCPSKRSRMSGLMVFGNSGPRRLLRKARGMVFKVPATRTPSARLSCKSVEDMAQKSDCKLLERAEVSGQHSEL